jgi:pyrophosphate--fructose-6-phosphate 1-phosphotransferase
LLGPPSSWVPAGIPITSLLHLETRKGRPTPVIRKALVDLDGAPFRAFAAEREAWAAADAYLAPGAIQYWGPRSVCESRPRTLALERG